jgi:hypothetical protein
MIFPGPILTNPLPPMAGLLAPVGHNWFRPAGGRPKGVLPPSPILRYPFPCARRSSVPVLRSPPLPFFPVPLLRILQTWFDRFFSILSPFVVFLFYLDSIALFSLFLGGFFFLAACFGIFGPVLKLGKASGQQ